VNLYIAYTFVSVAPRPVCRVLPTENRCDQLVRMKPDDGSDDIWLSTRRIVGDFMTYATDSIDWSHRKTGISTCMTAFGCNCLWSLDAYCEATWTKNIYCHWCTAV